MVYQLLFEQIYDDADDNDGTPKVSKSIACAYFTSIARMALTVNIALRRPACLRVYDLMITNYE